MAESKPEAATNAAQEQKEAMVKAREDDKDATRKKGLASLVKVEGVCSECGIVSVFHLPEDWIERWLNDGGGSPACRSCRRGLSTPGRASCAYHDGVPCALPDHLEEVPVVQHGVSERIFVGR